MVKIISRYRRRFQARPLYTPDDRVIGGFVNVCFGCFQIICYRCFTRVEIADSKVSIIDVFESICYRWLRSFLVIDVLSTPVIGVLPSISGFENVYSTYFEIICYRRFRLPLQTVFQTFYHLFLVVKTSITRTFKSSVIDGFDSRYRRFSSRFTIYFWL